MSTYDECRQVRKDDMMKKRSRSMLGIASVVPERQSP
jgi:hypothetical protein